MFTATQSNTLESLSIYKSPNAGESAESPTGLISAVVNDRTDEFMRLYFGLSISELQTPTRTQQHVKARWFLFWKLLDQGVTTKEIGKTFNRDHSTVIHSKAERRIIFTSGRTNEKKFFERASQEYENFTRNSMRQIKKSSEFIIEVEYAMSQETGSHLDVDNISWKLHTIIDTQVARMIISVLQP